MFCLAPHIIDEALEIATKMRDTGEQVVVIRSTGLFVVREVGDNSIELYE